MFAGRESDIEKFGWCGGESDFGMAGVVRRAVMLFGIWCVEFGVWSSSPSCNIIPSLAICNENDNFISPFYFGCTCNIDCYGQCCFRPRSYTASQRVLLCGSCRSYAGVLLG